MTSKQIINAGKAGFGTFLSSVKFFYGHTILVLISLIPALFRSYQMWLHLNTPIWIEVVVEATRVFLYMLFIALLSKIKINSLFKKAFWEQAGKMCSREFQKNWPHIFIAQIIVFIVVLFWLMNFLIRIIVNLLQGVIIDVFDIQDTEALHDSLIFFLKNMSVIPLSMVFILKMCGIGSGENNNLATATVFKRGY